MALQYIEGFDHYVDLNAMLDSACLVDYPTHMSLLVGRDGVTGQSLEIREAHANLAIPLPEESYTVIVGFAWMNENISATRGDICQMRAYNDEGGKVEATLDFDSAGVVYIKTGASTNVDNSTRVLEDGVWYYMEFYLYKHDTNGIIEVRIDGEIWATFTGDTEYNTLAPDSGISTIHFHGSDGDVHLDDIYLCDGSGSAPTNTYLGDCRVPAIYPNGDSGTPDWTKSTGSTNWERVDDPQEDIEYVSTSTATDEDLYTFDNVPVDTSDIYGVQVSARVSKDATADRAIALRSSSGSNDRTGANHYMNADKQMVSTMFEKSNDAGTVDWTAALVNAANFGIKLTV